MKKMTLLFPGSYMDYRKIDEDMQEEYRAAVETGLYHTILFILVNEINCRTYAT